MKKIMYNMLVGILAVSTLLVVAIGLTGNHESSNRREPTIVVVDEEVENEINRVYKDMAEETIEFFNMYGDESADVLYNVER